MNKFEFDQDVQPGDLVWVQSFNLDSEPKIVFVTHVEGNEYIEACLTSEMVDLATSYDLILRPEHTELPYSLIIQTKLSFNAFTTQIYKTVAILSDEFKDHIIKIIDNVQNGQKPKSKIFDFGVTVNAREDMKNFKDEESLIAMKLGLDCYLALNKGTKRIINSSLLSNISFLSDLSSIDQDAIQIAGDYEEETMKNPDTYNAYRKILNSQLQDDKIVDLTKVERKEEIENLLIKENLSGWIYDFEGDKDQTRVEKISKYKSSIQITYRERIPA
tara:strand:- start:620 stop:1441 length:822 start_codon:yes stop_codon:yes gene_type:complete